MAAASLLARVSDDGQRLYLARPEHDDGGVAIYRMRPFALLTKAAVPGSISVCSPLGCTSLMGICAGHRAAAFSSRSVILFNVATDPPTLIVELRFDTAVLNVLLNVQRLVAVCRQKVHVYDLATMAHLVTLETADNPHGVATLSQDLSAPYLVYPKPDSARDGVLLIYDAQALNTKSLIEAHRSPLSCISMSACGSRIATTSTKGTMVRVFALPSGSLVQTFRRGSTPARVTCMTFFSVPLRPDVLPTPGDDDAPSGSYSSASHAFSTSNAFVFDDPGSGILSAGGAPACLQPSFLVVASNMPTVHIFKLKEGPRVPPFLLLPRRLGAAYAADSGAEVESNGDSHSAPISYVPVPPAAAAAHAGDASPTQSRDARERGSHGGSFASAVAQAAEAAFSAAIGLEGDRDFAVIKLASVYEAGGVGDTGDPHAAADPPLAACITPAWFHVLPHNATHSCSSRTGRSQAEVAHMRGGSVVYSLAEESDDPDVRSVSLRHSNATTAPLASNAEAGSRRSPRADSDVVKEALAARVLPPAYIVSIISRGGRVLQYSFDPQEGGVCDFLGDANLAAAAATPTISSSQYDMMQSTVLPRRSDTHATNRVGDDDTPLSVPLRM